MKTFYYDHGINGPVVLWAKGSFQEDEFRELVRCLEELIPEETYTIAAFEAESWNDEYSPWQAECGRQSFGGKGADTLCRIKNELLPEINRRYPDAGNKYIIGYSLAGLFSLWALIESRLFDGAASVSGSLWYPGWMEYAENHLPEKNSIVYLSLGSKEKNSRDPQMALVEENTRRQKELLENRIRRITLEMNPGGHFTQPALRLAKAVAWLIQK